MSEFNFNRTLRRLRMRHFELLTLLGQEGTVRAASRRMALTQPALSKMLQEIEECFGTSLFERSRSGMVPTAAGQFLIDQAINWMNQLNRAGVDVARLADGAGATLRIGTISVMPRVMQAIAALRVQDPHVVVRIRERTVVASLAALAEGELDCVVGALPPELLQSEHVESVLVEPLAEDRLCVVASPAHPLARAKRLGWAQLSDQPWVLPPKESLLRRAFIESHLQAGLPLPEPAVELMSPSMLGDLIARDPHLLGLMRLEQAHEEEAAGRLRLIAVEPSAPLPPLSFMTLRRDQQPAVVQAFRNALLLAAQARVPAKRASRKKSPSN